MKDFLKQNVINYWDSNPVHSIECSEEKKLLSFCNKADKLRWSDNERWAKENFYDLQYLQPRMKVLDAGCGIGVFTRFYLQQNLDVDITKQAASITYSSLKCIGLKGKVMRGDIENLSFTNNFFDYIVSNGVIHHTPNTEQAVDEFYRVLKPGGVVSVSVYYRNFVLNKYIFNFIRFLLPVFIDRKKIRQRESLLDSHTPEEFVQHYDGNLTPIAKLYSRKEADQLFNQFHILKREVHYFPARFLKLIPTGGIIHKLLDKYCGTLIYYLLEKPVT